MTASEARDLSLRGGGAGDAARGGDDDENDNVDDALVLSCDQLQQVDNFRKQLLGTTDDADKLQLCAEKCSELLRDDTRLQILIAAYDDVMSAVCYGYKKKKQARTRTPLPTSRNKKMDNTIERDEWERYFGVAVSAARVKSNCLVALKAVALRWGREVVLHYEWASRGENFCNLLRARAIDIPKWSDFALASTVVMLRRHATVKRPCIAQSRDPITSTDLQELREPPFSELRDIMLPTGLGWDKFDMVVHEQFAVQLASVGRTEPPTESTHLAEPSDRSRDPELSNAPVTDCTEFSEPHPHGSFARRSLRPPMQPSYKEAPSRDSRTARSVQASTSAAKIPPPPCTPLSGVLCRCHSHRLLNQLCLERPATVQVASPADPTTRRRAASLPDINPTFKRPRLDDRSPISSVSARDAAPSHGEEADEFYTKQVLTELQHAMHTLPPDSHGKQTADLVQALLRNITPPNTDGRCGPIDAKFCTGIEASDIVESISPLSIPIITEGQQPFRWNENDRPIAQLLRRLTYLGRTVSVQVPSRSSTEDSFKDRTLREVRQRFLSTGVTTNPWNILDLQSPLPSLILPNFLTGENSGLLLHVRDIVLMERSAERVVAPSKNWNRWKNVLEWVLLSEGDHQTAPHMDSNGLSTWITVQEGCMGFGWMARPTEEEEKAWQTNDSYTGGRWRYVILRPGQTTFFTSGTIHFVFRVQGPQTMALGGHVLQWSGIERWMCIVLDQMANPMITNEDMEQTAPMYVHAISRLVEARMADGRIEELGGGAAVKRFRAAVEEFNKLYPPRKARRAR